MPDALRLALGTFTALRVPAPRRIDRDVAGGAMLLAPVTAVPLALVWVLLAWIASQHWLPAGVAAAVALAAGALIARGMHLDGLADTADGLTAAYDRDRALEVMRRGDTGPAGAAALVLVLLLQATALTALMPSGAGGVLGIVALGVSRLAPAIACRRGIPAARPSGLGRTVAGTVSPLSLTVLVVGVVAMAAAASLVTSTPWYAGVLVALAGSLAGVAVTRRATVRLGGITGDTIGAAIEISLATGLVAASAAAALLG